MSVGCRSTIAVLTAFSVINVILLLLVDTVVTLVLLLVDTVVTPVINVVDVIATRFIVHFALLAVDDSNSFARTQSFSAKIMKGTQGLARKFSRDTKSFNENIADVPDSAGYSPEPYSKFSHGFEGVPVSIIETSKHAVSNTPY